MESQIGFTELPYLKREQVKRMWLASTGAEVRFADNWVFASYPGRVFISFGESPLLPDPADTVVGVEML
jgi:hypothetical protein